MKTTENQRKQKTKQKTEENQIKTTENQEIQGTPGNRRKKQKNKNVYRNHSHPLNVWKRAQNVAMPPIKNRPNSSI